MINMGNIYYIAGLLEGEGCFGFYNNCPSIQISMTDLDRIRKAKVILDINNRNVIRTQLSKSYKHKNRYALSVSGDIAIQWMMTIYSLMGDRRKAKIKEIIEQWKARVKPSIDQIRARPKTLKDIEKTMQKENYRYLYGR